MMLLVHLTKIVDTKANFQGSAFLKKALGFFKPINNSSLKRSRYQFFLGLLALIKIIFIVAALNGWAMARTNAEDA
jgi:hypothetical protein